MRVNTVNGSANFSRVNSFAAWPTSMPWGRVIAKYFACSTRRPGLISSVSGASTMYRRKMYSLLPALAWKLSPSLAGFTMKWQFSRTTQSFDPSRAPRSTTAGQTTATATSVILVNLGFAQIVEVHLLDRSRQISGHATSERVPCASRIMKVVQRVCTAAEKLIVFTEKQGSMLAFFYRDIVWSHFPDPTPCFNETCFLRDLASFAVVQDEKVDAAKECIQISARSLNPKIHRVGNDETRTFHLIEHMRLQRRRDVGQQNEIGLPIRFWQRGFEMFKDIERDRARFARVQVPRILAGPAKSFSVYPLHAFAVDLARLPKLEFGFGKVVTHDADKPDRREEACAERCIGGRAA